MEVKHIIDFYIRRWGAGGWCFVLPNELNPLPEGIIAMSGGWYWSKIRGTAVKCFLDQAEIHNRKNK